jgi:ribonuclease HI
MIRLTAGSSSSTPTLGNCGYWWAACWQLLLVLRFDGSLHRPVDGTARMATAACALFRSHTSGNLLSPILLVGGTYVPSIVSNSNSHGSVTHPTTSAEAEFSGLLLGLEGLLQHREALLAEAALLASTDHPVILIQGDCKTVIQQMQGRARARKLDEWCDRANRLVDLLSQESPWKLQFEHIPRTENALCDGLCRQLVAMKRNSNMQSVCRALASMLENPTAAAATSGSLTALLGELLASRYLSNGKTNLSVPVRLDLYSNILAPLALRLDAYELLYDVGHRTQHLAATMTRKTTKQPPSSGRGTMSESSRFQLDGLSYQATALRKLGRDKEAAKVDRREWSLLLRHTVDASRRVTERQDLVASTISLEELKLRVLVWAEDGTTRNALRGIEHKPRNSTYEETVTRMADLVFQRLEDGSCTDDASQNASCWIPLGPFQPSEP